MCVRAVGVDRSTVVIDAVRRHSTRLTGKPKSAIGKQKRGVKPTARPSVDDG